ncbi:phosphotransferase [Clostridium sp. 'deep sea']|uniref:phosphotransferase n=1 Tax=Clostridium sp. 'deep sea' TaxID=2779445 RepID=UPI0018964143|nr:phosphotransferase [Clostridium sp. 'deep sea']QOR35299.1 phosphotransferase [Clostridium sp. 'deep sea']
MKPIIKTLQNCLNYIEQNLKSEIELNEIAELCGYSIDHLYKLFKQYLAMPINSYIVSRKLKHIAYEHLLGKGLNNLVLNYGFSTYSGFYKAFYKWFSCSPSRYKQSKLAQQPHVLNLSLEVNRMHSNKELKTILKNWNINVISITPYEYSGAGSIANNVWYINDNYVLKKGLNISGLKTHISISRALAKKELNAAIPMQTCKDKDFLVDGEFYYLLANRVPGNWLTKEQRYGEDSLHYAKCYGESIAKLHLVMAEINDEVEVKDKHLYNIINEWAIPIVNKMLRRFNYQLPNYFYKKYQQEFGELYENLPKQVIHRDPNPSNILFNNNRVSGFVDFEISEKNTRLYDVCYCATGILSETEDKPELYQKWLRIFNQTLDSYHRLNPLTEAEIKAIPYVLYSIQLNVIAYLSEYDKYSHLAEKNIKMLLFLIDNTAQIINKLIPNI